MCDVYDLRVRVRVYCKKMTQRAKSAAQQIRNRKKDIVWSQTKQNISIFIPTDTVDYSWQIHSVIV